MPVFKCSKCGHVDNTALTGYWHKVTLEGQAPLCSLCDPEIAKWHDSFERFKPEDRGLVEGPDGFLYSPDEEYYKRQLRELPAGMELAVAGTESTAFICQHCGDGKHELCVGLARDVAEPSTFGACECTGKHPIVEARKKGAGPL